MKGAAPSAAQRRFWSALCELGCVACRRLGFVSPPVSVHHIDGRTKPGAHWLVLPLCAGHHQDATGVPGFVAVHPYKARFEAAFGRQRELLGWCLALLVERGYTGPTGPSVPD